MMSIKRYAQRATILTAVVAALLGFAALWAGEAHADTLPAETCSYDAPTNTRTCELWAVAGTVDLPGWAGMPIWGYTDTDPALGGTAQVPGPAIIANQGEIVQVNLHNALPEQTALVFTGQAMRPDLAGAAPGGLASYTFVAGSPGTYLYEAGLLPGAQHQVAMGLYGALIVRPLVAGQAYDDPASAFDDEALLVLGEIDPALNTRPDPASFDMRDYQPRFWLINGQAFPNTALIPSLANHRVLLRYANAGIVQHAMGTLGMGQQVIAVDGNPLTYPFRVASATIGSGQTSDRLVTVPATAGTNGHTHYAVYDTSLLLHNNGATGYGGLLTFVYVEDGTPPGTGPVTSAVALAPNPANGSVDVTLSATVSGPVAITAAEYFVDTSGAGGAGIAMAPVDGAFDSPTEDVAATIGVADLALLASGDHTFYVHGSDGVWGAFNVAVLHLDKLGPATGGTTLAPNPSNGSLEVLISATGDDTATGNTDIAGAEFFIDAAGGDGTGTALTVNVAAPIASLDGSIDAPTMGGLSEGSHTVYVHSMDAFGWWGDYDTATLVVDRTGPATSNVVANPNPNNGALPYSPTVYAVRVDAAITDESSTILMVEGYIDADPGEGLGFPFTPVDALFDEMVEDAYAFVPLATINHLAEGPHQIYVRGKDASGNWGAPVSGELVIDKGQPAVSDLATDYVPGAVSFTLTASATDVGSGDSMIARGEYYFDSDPGMGNGAPMAAVDGAFDSSLEDLTATVNALGLAAGDHTLYVRARDAAGNWSPTASLVITIMPPDAIFADSFASGDLSAWTSMTGTGLSVTPEAAMDGDGFGLQVAIGGPAASFVSDGTPANEPSYHARFYFNPNTTRSGNTQQTIFAGETAAAAQVFRVEYRRQGGAANGIYQVRGWVQTAGGAQTTNWVTIASNSAHAIEIAWESSAAASFSLYVDGNLEQTLAGLDTSAYLLDIVHLGPSAGLPNNALGIEYFDAFVSRRYTVIGP